MVRKKQNESQEETGAATASPPVDEIAGGAAASTAADQPKKQWTKRPDPFGIHSINWNDGYKVSLLESDSNREVFIRFGNGSKDDAPKNFEAIRTMFKEEYGLYWDPKVQGWAKGLKQGVAPLVREQNRNIRAAVAEAYYKAIELEEASERGPSLSEQAKERSGVGR